MKNDSPSSISRLGLGIALGAGILATILRIVPHPTNFSAVGALSLYGGARVKGWHAYAIPLGVMIFSDMLLWALSGFNFLYSLGHPSRVFVYASFMIYVWIGRSLAEKTTLLRISAASVLGGLQFFVMTNFCEWLFQPLYYEMILEPFRYSRDLNGLMMCFAAALPFYPGETPFGEHPFALLTDFRLTIVWTILGDIIFATYFILIHDRLAQRATQTQDAPAPATNTQGVS